jgi:hypothetical protein
MAVGIRHADHVASSIPKVDTNFADKRQSLGRCSPIPLQNEKFINAHIKVT